MTDAIKDGVYGQVSGTVGRVNDGRFTVEVQRENARYPDYVTVWRLDQEVTQGDRITVKGWLSWKKTERNGKTYMDVSVNQPQVLKHEPAQPSVDDAWGGSDVPF